MREAKQLVLAVTKESGNVRLGEMQLKDGFNTISLYLEEKAENLEFVLSNATGEDIVLKRSHSYNYGSRG